MVRISGTANLSSYEKKMAKQEEDYLLIGKEDKTISVVSNGESIDIKELPIFNRTGTNKGVVTMPTDNLPFVIQYGENVVPTNVLTEVEFNTPFESSCFQIQVTIKDNAPEDVAFEASPIDDTKFRVELTSTTSTNIIIYWFAIGF